MDPNYGSDGDNVEGISDMTMPGNLSFSMNDSDGGSGVFNMSNDQGLPGNEYQGNACKLSQRQNFTPNPYSRDMNGEGLQNISMPRNLMNDSNASSIYDTSGEGIFEVEDPGILSMSTYSSPGGYPLNTSRGQSPRPYPYPNSSPNRFSPGSNINEEGLFGITEPRNLTMNDSNASSMYDTSGAGIFEVQNPSNLSMSTFSTPRGYASRGQSPYPNSTYSTPNRFSPRSNIMNDLIEFSPPQFVADPLNTSRGQMSNARSPFRGQSPRFANSANVSRSPSPNPRNSPVQATYAANGDGNVSIGGQPQNVSLNNSMNRSGGQPNRNPGNINGGMNDSECFRSRPKMAFSPLGGNAVIPDRFNTSGGQGSIAGSPARGQSPRYSNGANMSGSQIPNSRNASPGRNINVGGQPQNTSMNNSMMMAGHLSYIDGPANMNDTEVFRSRPKMAFSPPPLSFSTNAGNISGGMNDSDIFRSRPKMAFSPPGGNVYAADRFNTSGGQGSNSGSPFRGQSPGLSNGTNISRGQTPNSRSASPGTAYASNRAGNVSMGGQPQNVSQNANMMGAGTGGGMDDGQCMQSRPKMGFSPPPQANVGNVSGGMNDSDAFRTRPKMGFSPPPQANVGNVSGGLNDSDAFRTRPKMGFSPPPQVNAGNVSGGQSPRFSPGRSFRGQTPNSRKISPRRANNCQRGSADAFIMQTLSSDASFQDVLRQTIQKTIQATFKELIVYQLDALAPPLVGAYLDEYYAPIVKNLIGTGVITPPRSCNCSTRVRKNGAF